MHKEEDPHHGSLIEGRIRDANGIILSTEIGASRENDKINEI
jgi:hypothetical protein